MLGKVLALITLGAFVLLSALLQSTSPSTIHPLGILAVFVLIYLLVLGALTFLLYACMQVVGSVSRKSLSLSLSKAYYYASVLALAPVMIIGMRSIGRAGWYDIFLVALFEVLACFYIAKRR